MTDSVAADGQTPITGALQGTAGSSIAPSWTFHADTTSGLFSPAVGALGIVANNFGMLVNSEAFIVTGATPVAPGSGYVVGDTIIISGGVGVLMAILTVATLSGSGVASVTVLVGGSYSTSPTSPASQASTSGSGSGATFTLTLGGNNGQISDLNSAALWTEFGATNYMAGAMAQPNGLGLANYIGSANIAAAVESSLPVLAPQGRLTVTSNTPVINSTTAGTAVFYTPYLGRWTPIHNGGSIIPYQLSGQLQLTLTSAQVADGIYDVFLAYNGGAPVIGTGPNWSAGTSGSTTAGSCARGTGTGGTALTRLQGINVNAATVSLTWNTGSGNNTLSVAANQGIYLGSLYMDHTAGQVTCAFGTGQNRKFGVWNAYNRVNLTLGITDPTSSWSYNVATIRASNATPASYGATSFNAASGVACNGAVVFSGLPEEVYNITFDQALASVNLVGTPAFNSTGWYIEIGVNSTTVGSGKAGFAAANAAWGVDITARLDLAPSLGTNNICCLELALQATAANFYGGSAMTMAINYRG